MSWTSSPGLVPPKPSLWRPSPFAWARFGGGVCALLFCREYYSLGYHVNHDGLVLLGACILLFILPQLSEFKFFGIEGKLRELARTVEDMGKELRAYLSFRGLGIDNRATAELRDNLRRSLDRLNAMDANLLTEEARAMGTFAAGVLELYGDHAGHALLDLPALRIRIPEMHYVIGLSYLRGGRLNEAETQHKTLADWGKELGDGRLQAMGLMGQALIQVRRARSGEDPRPGIEKSLPLYDAASKLDSRNALVYLNRAAAYCALGDHTRCRKDLWWFKVFGGLRPEAVIEHIETDADKGFGGLPKLLEGIDPSRKRDWKDILGEDLEGDGAAAR